MRKDTRIGWGLLACVVTACAALGLAAVSRASYPGRNGTIATTYSGQAVLLTPNGKSHKLPLKGYIDRLVWSRDGKRLLVSSADSSIYVTDANGRRLTRWPTIRASQPDATWSRSGNAIIYSRASHHCRHALVMHFFSDRSTTQITPCDGASLPTASPTNDTVAYVSYPSAIRLLDLRTGTVQTILSTLDGEPAGGIGPAWSPDGRELAFSTGRTLAAYNVATGRLRTIVPADADQNVGIGSVAWSPDGKQITFVRYDPPSIGDNETHLYFVNADGTDMRGWIGLDVANPDWRPIP